MRWRGSCCGGLPLSLRGPLLLLLFCTSEINADTTEPEFLASIDVISAPTQNGYFNGLADVKVGRNPQKTDVGAHDEHTLDASSVLSGSGVHTSEPAAPVSFKSATDSFVAVRPLAGLASPSRVSAAPIQTNLLSANYLPKMPNSSSGVSVGTLEFGGRNSDGAPAQTSTGEASFLSTIFAPINILPGLVGHRLEMLICVLAVTSAILMQLTPLPTVARIVSCKSTLGMEALPFFTLLFSASLWLLYGTLRVEPTILLPNASGVVAGAWFVLSFWANSGRDDKQKFLLEIYLKVGVCTLACLALVCLVFPYDKAELIVGLVASVVNFVSYAAPLSALRVVLKERSTATMPTEVSVGNFVCSALWLAYGCIGEDLFIVIPNLLGFCVGAAQLVLLALIPSPSRQGFAAVCSSRRRTSAGGGGFGGGTFVYRGEEFAWSEDELFFADGVRSACTPLKTTSVCVNAPSLPTHDEVLKQCGVDST